jgi:hypothetical protein
MKSALRDWLGAPWAGLYWNTRKTLYILRRPRGECPCHDPSDDGQPGRTRCLAVVHWRSPARFARICPLLVKTEHGWCCSVRAEKVRPFWGRLLAAGAIGTLAAHFLGTLAVFGTLKHLGYDRLRYRDIVWPGNWGHFHQVQADYYRVAGREALRRSDFQTALLAYATAMQIDPDYETGLMLARMWGYAGSHGYSDMLFAQLLERHPDRAEYTAVVYHDQLLQAMRYPRLAEFSLQRLESGGQEEEAWIRALFVALEHGRLAKEFRAKFAPRWERLSPRWQTLGEALALAQTGRAPEAGRLLRTWNGTGLSPAWLRLSVEILVRLGEHDSANLLFLAQAHRLSGFDRQSLQYLLTATGGGGALRASDFAALLQPGLDARKIDRLCSLLVETRDAAALHALAKNVLSSPGRRDDAVAAALWAAGLASNASDVVLAVESARAADGRPPFPPIRQLDLTTAKTGDHARLRLMLATVPVPRETGLALLRQTIGRGASAR